MSREVVYTQQQQIQFIRRIFKKCKEVSEQSGISLRFILAQAALEAYWGKSVKQNNLFGVKPDRYWKKNHLPTQKFWTKEEKNGVTKRVLGTFCAYKDEDDSIQGWLDFLRRNPRYKKLFDPTIRSDYEKVVVQIRLSAYATDSKYVFKILGTIEGPTMRKALAGYSINEQIKHVAYKYKPAKPSPLPKSSTDKKQLNKSATNINQHPHAAETGEAWHQNSHYNLKRWNIAPRFHSTFKYSSGDDLIGFDAADDFHRFCQRQLNEIELMEMEIVVPMEAGNDTSSEVTWPLETNVIRRRSLQNTFGPVRKRGLQNHQGWDLEARVGTPVYAIGDGKIVFTDYKKGLYGTQLCMSFEYKGKTYYAFYAHLSRILVKVNQKVEMNDCIGFTGETGNARGMAVIDQHLHFEIRTSPAHLGTGLGGRLSPIVIYGTCPLNAPISG